MEAKRRTQRRHRGHGPGVIDIDADQQSQPVELEQESGGQSHDGVKTDERRETEEDSDRKRERCALGAIPKMKQLAQESAEPA